MRNESPNARSRPAPRIESSAWPSASTLTRSLGANRAKGVIRSTASFFAPNECSRCRPQAIDHDHGLDDRVVRVDRRDGAPGDHPIAMLVADEQPRHTAAGNGRARALGVGARRAGEVVTKPAPLLVPNVARLRRHAFEHGSDRAGPGRRTGDVGERHRPERGACTPHQIRWRRPRSGARRRVIQWRRRDVRHIGVAVVVAPAGRCGHQIGVRAHEAPDEPGVRAAERPDALR